MSVKECEDLSLKGWTNGFGCECLSRSLPVKEPRVEHMTGRWRVMPGWIFSWVSRRKGHPAKYSRNFLFGKKLCLVLPSLYSHYIYPHCPQIVRGAFQIENPRKYTWELEIVIPTIIYTFPSSFPQLLPLHLHFLERLQAQTFTTPILSVKWYFGTIGKYRKEPFIGGCNRVELRDPEI